MRGSFIIGIAQLVNYLFVAASIGGMLYFIDSNQSIDQYFFNLSHVLRLLITVVWVVISIFNLYFTRCNVGAFLNLSMAVVTVIIFFIPSLGSSWEFVDGYYLFLACFGAISIYNIRTVYKRWSLIRNNGQLGYIKR